MISVPLPHGSTPALIYGKNMLTTLYTYTHNIPLTSEHALFAILFTEEIIWEELKIALKCCKVKETILLWNVKNLEILQHSILHKLDILFKDLFRGGDGFCRYI